MYLFPDIDAVVLFAKVLGGFANRLDSAVVHV